MLECIYSRAYEIYEYLWRPIRFLSCFQFYFFISFSIFLIDHATKIIHCKFFFYETESFERPFPGAPVVSDDVHQIGCVWVYSRVCSMVCTLFSLECLLFKYVFIIYRRKALFRMGNRPAQPTSEVNISLTIFFFALFLLHSSIYV